MLVDAVSPLVSFQEEVKGLLRYDREHDGCRRLAGDCPAAQPQAVECRGLPGHRHLSDSHR